MKREHIKNIAVPIAAVLASIGIGFAGVSSAETALTDTSQTSSQERGMGMRGERPVVMGKVTAVAGTVITVRGTNPSDQTVTSYSVDVSGAKITKVAQGVAPVVSNASVIAVGDTVAVRGTVSGTNVVATEVIDGLPGIGMHRGGMGKGMGTHGTVTAVNGTTITITGADGTTYTVDGSKATVGKMVTISVGDIKVGDTIGVQGAVSGTNVTADHIMDGVPLMGTRPAQQ